MDEGLAHTGNHLQVAGKAKVALNERHSLDLAQALTKQDWPLPGKCGNSIIITYTMSKATVFMRNDQFEIALHAEGTLHHKAATGCSPGQEVFPLHVHADCGNLPGRVCKCLDVTSIWP